MAEKALLLFYTLYNVNCHESLLLMLYFDLLMVYLVDYVILFWSYVRLSFNMAYICKSYCQNDFEGLLKMCSNYLL